MPSNLEQKFREVAEVQQHQDDDAASVSSASFSTPFKRAFNFMAGSGQKARKTPDTERRRRKRRQLQARRKVEGWTLSSILVSLFWVALIAGGVSSIILHEVYLNSRTY